MSRARPAQGRLASNSRTSNPTFAKNRPEAGLHSGRTEGRFKVQATAQLGSQDGRPGDRGYTQCATHCGGIWPSRSSPPLGRYEGKCGTARRRPTRSHLSAFHHNHLPGGNPGPTRRRCLPCHKDRNGLERMNRLEQFVYYPIASHTPHNWHCSSRFHCPRDMLSAFRHAWRTRTRPQCLSEEFLNHMNHL